MQQIEFRPLGRSISCLGLGCARLDGRVDLRRSANLIETALELGVTYFDVAASYGTAEEAVGRVLRGVSDVVVATKVGPPSPPYNTGRMRLKAMVRPLLDSAPVIKGLLRSGLSRNSRQVLDRPVYDFSQTAIERSLTQSLERLQRSRIDVFLAHEPQPKDLAKDVASGFQSFVDQGMVGAFGVGIGACSDQWEEFGSVWQSGWPGEAVSDYAKDVFYSYHGVMRLGTARNPNRRLVAAAELIRTARRLAPNSLLIVSASTPARLRELARAVTDV